MNYIKLSALLLTASGSLVYAKAQNFFEEGKKYGSIAISAMKSATEKKAAPRDLGQKLADRINQRFQTGVMGDLSTKMRFVLFNLSNDVETILKRASTTPEGAKVAWENFQDFFRGFKQVVEKDIPTTPSFFSEAEKKGFELCVEAIKLPLDFALASKDFTKYTKNDFAEYTKSWQTKIDESMSKLLKTSML
jgi:hypothetical protein